MQWQLLEHWGVYVANNEGDLVYSPMLKGGSIFQPVASAGGMKIKRACEHFIYEVNAALGSDFKIENFKPRGCRCVSVPEAIEICPA